MTKKDLDKQIIQVSKEFTVKFIEVGRISPSSFSENFQLIYTSVNNIIKQTVSLDTQDIEKK